LSCRHGKTRLVNAIRSGRPKEATTDEIIQKVRMLGEWRLKLTDIADTVGMSTQWTHDIF